MPSLARFLTQRPNHLKIFCLWAVNLGEKFKNLSKISLWVVFEREF